MFAGATGPTSMRHDNKTQNGDWAKQVSSLSYDAQPLDETSSKYKSDPQATAIAATHKMRINRQQLLSAGVRALKSVPSDNAVFLN